MKERTPFFIGPIGVGRNWLWLPGVARRRVLGLRAGLRRGVWTGSVRDRARRGGRRAGRNRRGAGGGGSTRGSGYSGPYRWGRGGRSRRRPCSPDRKSTRLNSS